MATDTRDDAEPTSYPVECVLHEDLGWQEES